MAEQPAKSIDATALPLAALADELADRLAARLIAQLAELAQEEELKAIQLGVRASDPVHRTSRTDRSPPSGHGWWTAARVAEHYSVGVRFIYSHADELGCVRLGGGRRPRLRFDPAVVARRWSSVGDQLPQESRTRRARRGTTRQTKSAGADYQLIEFDRDA